MLFIFNNPNEIRKEYLFHRRRAAARQLLALFPLDFPQMARGRLIVTNSLLYVLRRRACASRSCDRAQFGSEPRGFLAGDTPLDRGGSSSVAGSSIRGREGPAATPQPTPLREGLGGEGGSSSSKTYNLSSLKGGKAPADDEWEAGSNKGDDEQEGAGEADAQMDRDWYDAEEGGRMVDETHTPFLGDEKLFEKREEQMRKRVNHRREARLRDADRWEEGRLRASGMVTMVNAEEDDDDQELRTRVVVHDMKLPFLDGRVVYSKQSESR